MFEHRRAEGPAVDLDYDVVSTLARYQSLVGTINVDHLGNVFVLVPGVASSVAGDTVTLEGSGATLATVRLTHAVAKEKHPQLAVMCAAVPASSYGWALLKYERDANLKFGPFVDASTAANVELASSATAGQLKDDPARGGATVHTVGQERIQNITLSTAQGGSAGKNTSGSWNFIHSGS